jgi:ParB/RepB/Spo0J family partition protein
MKNQMQSIVLDKLVAHPDNPNRMSKANFAKLVRNIRQTGKYEPLIVRPCPGDAERFQIINGHHRAKALQELGYTHADVLIWDIDDRQTDILLATLNRLHGSDMLEKKLALMKKLSSQMQAKQLARLLPQTARQLERLANFSSLRDKLPKAPAAPKPLAAPCVFFLSDEQLADVEDALFLAQLDCRQKTKAAKRAAALTEIARFFLASCRGTKR